MRDGAPALGRVRNLRTSSGGDVLLGDFVEVPKAVAAMMPKAWPQRSVEGLVDYTDTSGRSWRLVITACALLGATMPGVDGLADVNDVAELYGIAAKRVAIAARTLTPEADESRSRAVQVAAARRRRTNHTIGV
jgi:hypothetical protein